MADRTGDEIEYRGEEAPRSKWVAVAFHCALPGLGSLYLGHWRAGLATYCAFAALTVVWFAMAWLQGLFLPRVVLLWVTAWVYLQLFLLWQAGRWVSGLAGRYILRSFNHPLVYGGVWLLCGLLPAGLGLWGVCAPRIGTHDVTDTNEFAHLWPGDRVYFDRLAFVDTPVRAGDLVVVRVNPQADTIARVVATAGDTVEIHNDRVRVGGTLLGQSDLGPLQFAADVRPSVGLWQASLERSGAVIYQVFRKQDASGPEVSATPVLQGQLYVLADNRNGGDGRDSRLLGPVGTAAVRGRPLWVYWSRDPQTGRIRWNRIGLPVR